MKNFYYLLKKHIKISTISLVLLSLLIWIISNLTIFWMNPQLQAKIVIDPGHGGIDPGTIKNNLYEKDINLEISEKLKDYLSSRGFEVVLTREDDKNISLKSRANLAKKEKSDLFLSIHVNSNTNNKIRGMEVYWNTPKSKNFAEKIYDNLNANQLASRNRGLLNSRFYVIRRNSVPSALVEIGYITNYYDRCKLNSQYQQNVIVESIGDGILNYIKLNPDKIQKNNKQ